MDGHCGESEGRTAESTSLLRAAVVANSPVLSAGLHAVLGGTRVEVAGSVHPGAGVAEQLQALAPDVAFVEAQLLAAGDGPAVAALRRLADEVAIIVLSLAGTPVCVERAVELGARGYLSRDLSAQSLLLAVDAALRDCMLMDRPAFLALAQAANPAQTVGLTARERQVLRLVAQGLGNREIADMLAVGAGTVRTHVSRILGKIGARDRVHATLWAAQHGLGSASHP